MPHWEALPELGMGDCVWQGWGLWTLSFIEDHALSANKWPTTGVCSLQQIFWKDLPNALDFANQDGHIHTSMVHNDRVTFADTHTVWSRAQFPETMHRELSAVKTHAGVHVQQDNIIWHFLYVDGESCMEPRDHHPSLQVIVFGKDIGTNYMYGHMICTFRDVFHPMPNKKYMPPRNVMCFTLKLRIRVHVATQMFLGKLWHRVPDRIQEFNPAVVDQMQLWPTLD